MAVGVRHHCARLRLTEASIREFGPSDEEPVVGLSPRAWEPVFAAVEEMLGTELFVRLRGGGPVSLGGARGARRSCPAGVGGGGRWEPIGFVAATLRQSGMPVAVIETCGGPGHAPARWVYEEAGYSALPAVRFFKACSGSRRRLASPDCVSGRDRTLVVLLLW